MFVKCNFYNPKTDSFGGREYSYRCNFPVQPGDIVRVPAGEGTSVCRVTRIVEAFELGCPEGLLRDVVCFERDNPSVSHNEAPAQLAIPEAQEESHDIIVIRQLPIIEEHLYALRDNIKTRVESALSYAVTEDTLKDVKKIRADLNAQFKMLEDQRKQVKKQIMAPYDQFESVYAECVTNIFSPADKQLKGKIDEVENGLKDEKRTKLKAYFNEYRDSLGVDPLMCDFDRMGINVLLSTSDKQLKTQAKAAVDQIAGDMQTISGMENADEIMTEYRVARNLNLAIQVVRDRHARIEAEKQRRAEMEAREAERQAQLAAAAAKVEEVIETLPESEMPPETIYVSCRSNPEPSPVGTSYCDPQNGPVFVEEELPFIEFRVYGTIDQLKAVKKFLVSGGYKYEQL